MNNEPSLYIKNYGKIHGLRKHDFLSDLYKEVSVLDRSAPGGIDNPTLVHYSNLDSFEKIISNKTLRFTDVGFLNDSTEFQEGFLLLKWYLEKNQQEYDPGFVKLILDDNFLDILSRYEQSYLFFDKGKEISTNERMYKTYTCSFCMELDDLAMWNSYARGNNGVAIDFIQQENLFGRFEDKNIRLRMGKVVYSLEDKTVIIKNILKEYNRVYCEVNNTMNDINILICSAIKETVNAIRCFFKNVHFDFEKEYRAVLQIPATYLNESENLCKKTDTNQSISPDTFTRNNVIIPCVYYPFDSSLIGRIIINPYVGPEREMVKLRIEEILNSKQLPNTEILYSAIPIRKY